MFVGILTSSLLLRMETVFLFLTLSMTLVADLGFPVGLEYTKMVCEILMY